MKNMLILNITSLKIIPLEMGYPLDADAEDVTDDERGLQLGSI